MSRLMYERKKGISRVFDPSAKRTGFLRGRGLGLVGVSFIFAGAYFYNVLKSDRSKEEGTRIEIEYEDADEFDKHMKPDESVKSLLPKDSLQPSNFLWGAVKGNQDLLMPEELNSLTVNDDNDEFVFAPRKPAPEGFIKTHLGIDKLLRFKTSSKKSIYPLELLFSTRAGEYELKKAGEYDSASPDGFSFTKEKEKYSGVDNNVEDLTVFLRRKPLMVKDENGNTKEGAAQISDIISICRIPFITGNPERAVYLRSFTPEKMVLEELLGKPLDTEMNVEISFLEAGASETFIMKPSGSASSSIDLNLDPKAYGLKDGQYCHVSVNVTAPTRVHFLDKKLRMFKRLLLVRNGKFIDPFDSVKNSAYEQSLHKDDIVSEPVLLPVRFQNVHGLSVGSAHYIDLFSENYLIELKNAKNSQDADIKLRHWVNSKPYVVMIRNGKPVRGILEVGSKKYSVEIGLASPVREESQVSIYFSLLNPEKVIEDSMQRIQKAVDDYKRTKND